MTRIEIEAHASEEDADEGEKYLRERRFDVNKVRCEDASWVNLIPGATVKTAAAGNSDGSDIWVLIATKG